MKIKNEDKFFTIVTDLDLICTLVLLWILSGLYWAF